MLGLIVLLSGFSFLYAQTDSALVWQLAFLHKTAGRLESLSISQVSKLKDGDQFKLKISSDDDASCYVIDEQGDGSVAVLYNAKLKAFETQALPGDADDALFVLSPPDGTDKIHIIVSDAPVKTIELLLAKLEKEGASPAASRNVLDEIARIKQNLSPRHRDAHKAGRHGRVNQSSHCSILEQYNRILRSVSLCQNDQNQALISSGGRISFLSPFLPFAESCRFHRTWQEPTGRSMIFA